MMIKKIAIAALVVLGMLQFFQIDKKTPATAPNNDLKVVMNPPAEIYNLLEAACFDCHSNFTKYPVYANFQPVGWWLQGHIKEARRELNFSEFAGIPLHDRAVVLRHCAEEIEKGKMPLKSYTWLHAEARLSAEQKQRLVEWLRNPIPADLSTH